MLRSMLVGTLMLGMGGVAGAQQEKPSDYFYIHTLQITLNEPKNLQHLGNVLGEQGCVLDPMPSQSVVLGAYCPEHRTLKVVTNLFGKVAFFCITPHGGAEVFCRDVERRYLAPPSTLSR
jgi:hypothetical protein